MSKLFTMSFLFILSSLIISSDEWKENLFAEKSTSFGLMSEKLGTDFFNFSWVAYKKDSNDIFISIGPSVFIPNNVGLGWKHYFKTRNKITPFSCLALFERAANKMNNSSGDSIREDTCIGVSGGISYLFFESKKRDIYLNLGVFISYDFRNDPFVLPVINVEFKRSKKK